MRFRNLIVALVFLFGLSNLTAQLDQTGYFRFVHAIPGVTAVDVYVDDQLTVVGLDFGEASTYIGVPAGTRSVSVAPGGVTTALWSQQVESNPSEPRTLIASSIDPPQFDVFVDDFTPAPLGTSRMRLIHAIAGAGGVDVVAGADNVASNLTYGASVGTFDIPADVYSFSVSVTGGGDAVLPATPFSLVSNTTNMIVLYGTPSIPAAMQLSAPTAANDGDAFLRMAHGVAEAGAVDILIDGTKAVPAVEFGVVTEHLPLPAGDYTVTLQGGDGTALLEASVSLAAGTAQTAVALGSPDGLTVDVFSDAIEGVDATSAVVSVVNTIPGDSIVTATLADGTVLADSIPFGSSSNAIILEPTTQNVVFDLTIDGQTASFEQPQTFYGGVYYNGLALSGTMFTPPALNFAPTSLARTVNSAPGAGDAVVVEAQPPTVAPPTVAPPAVAPPTVAPPTVAPPTEAPTLPPVVVTVTTDNPTARVVLNPGANLQLRQYPSPDAFSLGLAPSGTVLEVVGRAGAPIDVDGVEIPVETLADGTEVFFEDPAEALDPEDRDADLDPEGTWLNVIYNTPDGGQIEAWINALYVDVRAPDGEEFKLADLPLIPQNRPGEAIGTALTPPSPTENRVTVRVINIDPGANLNVRRTPNTGSEVLARLPGGTVAELLGLADVSVEEDDETTVQTWALIEYTPPQGGVITGWVSTRFVEYQLNGETEDLEFLESRDFIKPADLETIGFVSADVAPVAPPTPNPTRDAFIATVATNPDTNLNMRRAPDDQSEVAVRVPSGAQLIVEGRTEDSAWLRTSFEGQPGWIASPFVFVTFNGANADIDQIPVIQVEQPAATEETAG